MKKTTKAALSKESDKFQEQVEKLAKENGYSIVMVWGKTVEDIVYTTGCASFSGSSSLSGAIFKRLAESSALFLKEMLK